jgi:hypothetical protein
MVVLTPDSPVDFYRDDLSDVLVFGHANSVTATCLDLSAADDEEDEDICSLRTTTVSQGVINFVSASSPLSTTDFTTIQQVQFLVSSEAVFSSRVCPLG